MQVDRVHASSVVHSWQPLLKVVRFLKKVHIIFTRFGSGSKDITESTSTSGEKNDKNPARERFDQYFSPLLDRVSYETMCTFSGKDSNFLKVILMHVSHL